MAAEKTRREGEVEIQCVCPFCDAEVDASAPWCEVCQVVVRFCAVCGEPLPREASECPECGASSEE
jgi:hypothetical protein